MNTTLIRGAKGKVLAKKTAVKICFSSKGIIFSIDAIVATTIILCGVMVFAITLSNYSTQTVQGTQNLFLQEKTLAIADSLVKNHNEENSLLGACTVDVEKKRVKSNEVTLAGVMQAKPFEAEGFFVKQLRVETKTYSKILLLSQKDSNNCVSAKRFALVDGEKGIVEVTGCLDETGKN